MSDPPLDKPALLAHIKAKADHHNLVAHAFLMALHTAIVRGDFDEPTGPGTTPDLPNE